MADLYIRWSEASPKDVGDRPIAPCWPPNAIWTNASIWMSYPPNHPDPAKRGQTAYAAQVGESVLITVAAFSRAAAFDFPGLGPAPDQVPGVGVQPHQRRRTDQRTSILFRPPATGGPRPRPSRAAGLLRHRGRSLDAPGDRWADVRGRWHGPRLSRGEPRVRPSDDHGTAARRTGCPGAVPAVDHGERTDDPDDLPVWRRTRRPAQRSVHRPLPRAEEHPRLEHVHLSDAGARPLRVGAPVGRAGPRADADRAVGTQGDRPRHSRAPPRP